MAQLKVWKTNFKVDESKPWYMYTVQGMDSADPPFPMTEKLFSMIFPDIPLKEVPLAPKTGIIEVRALLLRET